MASGLGPALADFAKDKVSGFVVIAIGAVAFIGGVLLAPELVDNGPHNHYEPFFAAAAGLVTGIFVVLLLEARHITSSASLAVATVFFVGASATAAVTALLPDLSDTVYTVAFATVVGGGLAALTSTVMLAATALLEARETQAKQIAEELGPALKRIAAEAAAQAETATTTPPKPSGGG
jgi:hypothetical protein